MTNQTNNINQINHTNHINNTNHINQTNHTNHINKTAIITGASRGIGAAIAKKLASCGYNLSLCCRNSSDRLKALADELHCAYGIEVLCYTGNVGDFFFAKDMVTKTISHFGHIDVLINNAGISHIGLLSDMTPQAIAFTGICDGASSLPSALVNAFIPPLQAEYATSQDAPTLPQTEEICSIRPHLSATI